MNYEIIDLKLESGVISKGDRKGQKWEGVRATMRPQAKGILAMEQARIRSFFFFNEQNVALLKAFIGKKGGNTAANFEENKPLPDEYRIQEHGFEVPVDMGGWFCRIYTQDVRDTDGRLLHEAHTRRKNSNNDFEPPTRTMIVLAFKVEDPDPFAEQPWRWSENPKTTMEQIRDRYYRPAEAFESTTPERTVAPSGDEQPPVENADADAELQAKLKELEELKAKLGQ